MDQGPTLPGVETGEDVDRIVLHVDLDCFYAACERLREPALEGEPVVVGMGYEPGDSVGAVATASYEAREHGVESAQAITAALDRLPRAPETGDSDRDPGPDADGEGSDPDAVGHYRPVDMEYYQSVAADVKAVLHDCAETVREVSIDEAYLDVTERTDWSVAAGYARHVKQRIDREVGLTASVGVAPTMHAAKVASDHDKPDGLVVVEPGEVAEFLAPLPVDDLHGIGPVTAGELRGEGIETVADLAAADRDWLVDRWGERGGELHDRARGVDPRVVEPRGRPKSLSRESAFAEPESDSDAVRERIGALASAVADRARSKEALYRTIGIKVVLPPYDVNTRARSLPGPVDDPDLVETVALDLLDEFDGDAPRKVGVRVSNLSFADADQATLGGWDGVGDASADDAVAQSRDSSGSVSKGEVPEGEVPEGESVSETESVGDGGPSSAGESGAADVPSSADVSSSAGESSSGAGSSSSGGSPSEAQVPPAGDRGAGEAPADAPASAGAEGSSPVAEAEEPPGQSVLDRVWSDGPAEHGDPEPIGQHPEQSTLSEFTDTGS